MNQTMYEMKTLLNKAGQTNAVTGGIIDLAPSAGIQRREMKVVVGYQILTAGTFPLALTECDTTDGTFTAVGGDTITSPTATQAAVGVAEYHVKAAKRYMICSLGTVAGTGAAANLIVLIQNLKRSSVY